MKTKLVVYSFGITLLAIDFAHSQSSSPSGSPVPVTVDNYNRAESDASFASIVKEGGFGKFWHLRESAPLDKQAVYHPRAEILNGTWKFPKVQPQ